jgi:acyl transferase domain-containing protein
MNSGHGADIAIIGMAGRFPGAPNIAAYWRNLRDGVESIATFSDDELAQAGVDPAALDDPAYVRRRGALDDIALFAAPFFGVTPREAEITDPQQRIFLECTWEALEHAGYDSAQYDGLIGVYAGAGQNTYLQQLYANPDLIRSVGEFQTAIGNEKDYLPTRVSYKLNLRGPSVSVQTACSTSLVAVHLACQSLLNGECDLALAGGVAIHAQQRIGYWYREGGVVAPDGHCRAFDASAQGTVPGSGVGVVVLKRLADALDASDTIHAVIKGSAINNDGAAKVGFTAPSADGQADVIAEALALAAIQPETVTYIEAHGTGTPLGDPIEIQALTQVFRASTGQKGFCALGSVKSNIGHLDAAAGVAGLIKTVLALKHGQLPPSLHFVTPNPAIDFAAGPFFVNTALVPWLASDAPRRAGVSSFGIGGTNAHLVLEEAPVSMPAPATRPWQLLVLSAKTSAALDQKTAELAAFLEQHPQLNLADVAYTLQVGRRAFEHRRILVSRDREDAARALREDDSARVLTAWQPLRDRPIAFMFPGQGAQHPQMAAGLYQSEAIFRMWVDRCATLLKPLLGLDVREIIFGGSGTSTIDESGRGTIYRALDPSDTGTIYRALDPSDTGTIYRAPTNDTSSASSFVLRPSSALLDQTQYAQPALFVIEYALAQLWMEWGVRPAALIGHSLGEYVAACLAGVFLLEDALALVTTRGRLMQELPPGAMLNVSLAEDKLRPRLGPQMALAAVNGPEQCVVSGPAGAIEILQQQLADQGIAHRRLAATRAFHSQMMDPIVAAFAEHVRRVELRAPSIPFISNLSGDWISEAEAIDPQYWAEQLRGTVRFAQGLHTLRQNEERVLLEVGPGTTLSDLARKQRAPDPTLAAVASMRHRADPRPDGEALLAAWGKLWLAGAALDGHELYAQEQRRRLPLPTYPFERQPYWVAAPKPATQAGQPLPVDEQQAVAPASGIEQPTALSTAPQWSPADETPLNPIEQRIAPMWRELLGVEPIGSRDDFFVLGGTSLVASLLLARLRETFDVEVQMRHIFEYPTLHALARLLEALFVEMLEALPDEEQERAPEINERVQSLALEELHT